MSKDIKLIILYIILIIYIYYFLNIKSNIYTYILITLPILIYIKNNNIIENFDINDPITNSISNHISNSISNPISNPIIEPSHQISNPVINPIMNPVIELNDKINFPFDLDTIKRTIYDIVSDDENIKNRIYRKGNNDKYYNILIQLIETDLDGLYKIFKKDYNKINDIVANIYNKENKLDKTKISSDSLSNKVNTYLKRNKNKKIYIDKNGFYKNKYDDKYDDDLKYSMYTKLQHQSLGENDIDENNQWDNDYIILNTDKWRPPIDHSFYRCKTESKCLVCPNMTTGYPVNLKDYNLSKKMLPPDIINVDYIKDVLNK